MTTVKFRPPDERRCAELIAQARRLGSLGGVVVADPDLYTTAEVRVADATIKRLCGDRFAVVRGRITIGPHR